MVNEVAAKQLRSFGLLVGGVFALIGLWPMVIYRADVRWWSIVLAALLMGMATVYPKALLRIYKVWMALGHLLGWVNTRIILGLIFYGVVTPIGLIRRLLGKDPMGKKLKANVVSYRILCSPRPASHLMKQY
jgi:hypothetical protein